MIVDSEDYWLLLKYHWRTDKDGYAVHSFKKNKITKHVKLHRVIMQVTDPSHVIDHINGNRLDNRKSNLRVVTRTQNCYNVKPRAGKYKGVHQRSPTRFEVSICKDGKKYYGGTYALEEDAAKRYNELATELFGPFAFLNEV